VAAGIRAVIRGAQAEFVLEYDCQFPSPPCWYMVRVTRFLGDGPVRAVVSHTDITERKEAELELQALYNATAYLFKSDNLRNLGYQIVQAISQEFSETDCALLLADKPNNQMQPLVYSENYAYPIGKVGENLRLDSLGLLSEVALTGKEAYIPQASHDAGANGKVETLRSQLILPLKAPDNIIGVLDLRRTGANAFSERDQRILSAFALRAANALKVLQLNEKLNHYAAQLETRVATRTAELQQSKNWAEAILANTSDVLLLSDAEGRVVQANPAFARQFLVSADFLIGKPLTSLIAQSSQKSFEEAVQQARDSLQPIDLDLVCIRSDDSLFEAEITIAPLMNKSSTSTNMVFSLRDITRHKQIEKSLRNALANEKELNELKSRFTSMVSHEFRTPLTVILSSTGILKSYADRLTPERRQGKLDSIEEQVKRLVKMLDAILLYSRAESISVESTRHLIDLQESCKQVISELQQIADQHLIDFMVVGEPYLVSMDSNLISEALRNLLSNAIKYSPGREKIDVTLQFNADHIWLKVRDYGIGIPEQDQKHLFEAFHRASNVGSISGTGLGLAIVDRAVKAHRGTIQVESQLNQGTAFVITIPRE
jgi:PAS domain S-box-containing protein